jgi:hypothetical protein
MNLVVPIVLTSAVLAVVYFQSDSVTSSCEELHPPIQDLDKRLGRIASILSTLADEDPAAVSSVEAIVSKIADDENERNALLQQRASSLLAAATLVVTIILATMGLMLKDAKDYLRGNDVRVSSYLLYGILLLFGASLYWTWVGFGTRPFVSFNMENLFDNIGKPGADLQTAQVVAIQQSYQMVIINSRLNTEKSAALRWATTNLFVGLLFFAIFCLFLLLQMNNSVPGKGETYGRSEEAR